MNPLHRSMRSIKGVTILNSQERAYLAEIIVRVVKNLQADAGEWVHFAQLGAPLAAAGVQYKQYGFPKLRPFLNEFQDVLAFKDVLPAEGKPPVCYVCLKSTVLQERAAADNREYTCKSRVTSGSEKPPYEKEKSALLALGYVINIKGALAFLAGKAERNIEQAELERKIKESYDNGDILYYEYDANGDPIVGKAFSDKTAVFAVNTGEQDRYHNNIFAQYSRGPRGWIGVYFNTKEQILSQMNTYKIGKLTFRNYAQANDFIKNLHSELLPGETWKYAAPAQTGGRKKTEYEILESYLRTVFAALVQEYKQPGSLNYGKIKFSKDNNFALFNTGLLSKYATDIIVIGEVFPKNGATNDRITLANPFVLKRGKTELQEKGFNASDADVDMVSFFDQVSQIVYDATAEVDTDDIEKLRHCIDEGILRNRFPEKCKEQYERGELEDLTYTFKKAIRRAERIARRNYKYVVPQYRTTATGNKIQFLMPIYMLSKYEDPPDFALVLSESVIDGQKFYKPETVLELAWAYNNARVICKPDDMWLNPANIEDVEDTNVDE